MVLEIFTEVNEEVKKIVDRKLKGRQVFFSYTCNSEKTRKYNRYIQVQTAFPSLERIHYEYLNGHWEFHIEPPTESDGYHGTSTSVPLPGVPWGAILFH